MISLRLLWLTQLCILPFIVQPYPTETLEKLMQEYSEGLSELKTIAKELTQTEGPDDLIKIAESELENEPEEYDFIIIGGGTSGSVIANRLSEVPEWHILLLEAGAPESKIGSVPAAADALQLSTYNWGYHTQPQGHACGAMLNFHCPVKRGKGLGGTSSINSMIYTRGNVLDYDRWADEELQSWCYDHVLPYFKKSENVALEHFDNKYHNKGGPLDVEEVQYQSPLAQHFLEAVEQVGEHKLDYNGKEQLGFGITQAMTNHGKRRSTSAAFLEPASHRKNLIVSPNSQVTQILIGDHTLEAKGVKYVKDGKLHAAKAKKEVILSAGIYNSPQLLMLSGIGPKEQLEHHEIPVKVELEGVGNNLQNHMSFLGLNFLINETEALKHHSSKEEDIKLWLTEGKGPLSSTQNVEALGYIKTKASKDHQHYPDVELRFLARPFYKNYGKLIKKSNNLADERYEAIFQPLEGHFVWSIQPTLLHPKSRGQIELKSKNPFHWPVINSKDLTDPDDHDVRTLVQGIRKALEISNTEAFKALGSKLAEVKISGCDEHGHDTDIYWGCAVRMLSVPEPQAGTCKMGVKSDKKAVVDEHLKVYGVKNLRVADNSIIPDALSAHETAPTIMIGEKAADLIKEHWK